MDFFGGGGGYNFDLGASSGAQGGANTAGGFSVGAFNLGSDNNNAMLLIGAGILAVGLVLVFKK